jgi:hypothetical protein
MLKNSRRCNAFDIITVHSIFAERQKKKRNTCTFNVSTLFITATIMGSSYLVKALPSKGISITAASVYLECWLHLF